MYKREFVGTATDYSNKENWLALPEDPDKDVDLIYLYPSSCEDPEADIICNVDNEIMRQVAGRNMAQQANAFEPVANIFAPYWRQVNALKLPMMSFEEVDNAEWAEPRTDVYAALDYYFENLNGGRPYFIAGHSQGSRLAYMVLSEYMAEHPDRYANMIAAYCIGDSLTRQYLADNIHVRAAHAADDLGVVVSWNTEGLANKGRNSLVIAPGAVAINPLNWRTDDTPADAALNLGSFVPHLEDPGMDELTEKADAVIDLERGSVMVMNPALAPCAITAQPGLEAFETVFGPASYHGCDYSFFYLNIRENARVRAEAWFKKMTAGDDVSEECKSAEAAMAAREMAKKAVVKSVIATKTAGKMATEAVGNAVETAKPAVKKVINDVKDFFDEVKEEVKKNDNK